MPHRGLKTGPKVVAFGSATVADSAATMTDFGFTAAQLALAHRAVISVATAAARMRYDGSAPTTTVGMLLDPAATTSPHVVMGLTNVANLQFIRTTGSSAVVSIQLEERI